MVGVCLAALYIVGSDVYVHQLATLYFFFFFFCVQFCASLDDFVRLMYTTIKLHISAPAAEITLQQVSEYHKLMLYVEEQCFFVYIICYREK